MPHVPSPCLCVFMGGSILHVLDFGWKLSTLFRVFNPSLPPTSKILPSMATAPNCNLRLFIWVTLDHELVLRSNFSTTVAPVSNSYRDMFIIYILDRGNAMMAYDTQKTGFQQKCHNSNLVIKETDRCFSNITRYNSIQENPNRLRIIS